MFDHAKVMMKMVISRFKVPAVIFVAFIGFAWVICSRLFNTSSSEIFYSEQTYHQDLARIYYDLGILRQQRGDLKKACRAFKNALQADASLLSAYDALGSAYERRKKSNKALHVYFKAMSIDSNFGLKQFSNQTPQAPEPLKEIEELHNIPCWKGQDLQGKIIYVYAEENHGDSIQFARFIKLLAQRAGKVYFKPPSALASLLARADLQAEIVPELVSPSSLKIDFYASLFSLPHLLGCNDDEIPCPDGYLTADEKKVAHFKAKFFKDSRYKIGIFLNNNEQAQLNNRLRAEPLEAFDLVNIAAINRAAIYSLCSGKNAGNAHRNIQNITPINLDQHALDLEDTAAIIANLDVLICNDNMHAHLAGALGKKVLLILPQKSDWQWMNSGTSDKAIWYTHMTKFVQTSHESLNKILDRVAQHLKQALKA